MFTVEYKWIRVAFFAVLFILLPSVLDGAWHGYWRYHYQTADITDFYEAISLEVGNVCVGQKIQQSNSVRFVYGTDTGWQADIVRELQKLENEKAIKVFEQSANVFIEKVPDGQVHREIALPELEKGLYRWDITVVKLYLPYGVERVITPTLKSNIFAVDDCVII